MDMQSVRLKGKVKGFNKRKSVFKLNALLVTLSLSPSAAVLFLELDSQTDKEKKKKCIKTDVVVLAVLYCFLVCYFLPFH